MCCEQEGCCARVEWRDGVDGGGKGNKWKMCDGWDENEE